MKKIFTVIALNCALGTMLGAQSAHVNKAEDEFPGLLLLPPGSIVKGLALPRYENHRVTGLLQADEMKVVSRREIVLTNIRATLYDNSGDITTVQCEQAGYDFKRKAVVAQAKAEVTHPNFSAAGDGVIFSTASRTGYIKGPVRTTIRTAAKKDTK
ncbi:MAG: hypothetical protein E7031_05485 [Akkermansiaceae bacterium]|nr:hypothetical protein [Akkermansiaceae bacterium]